MPPNPFISAFLSFIIPGLGQLYSGKTLRALCVSGMLLLPLVFVYSVFHFASSIDPYIVSGYRAKIVYLVLTYYIWGWNVVDAYRLASRAQSDAIVRALMWGQQED